jgi:hypothetical protein
MDDFFFPAILCTAAITAVFTAIITVSAMTPPTPTFHELVDYGSRTAIINDAGRNQYAVFSVQNRVYKLKLSEVK